jgi:hypothetical protein
MTHPIYGQVISRDMAFRFYERTYLVFFPGNTGDGVIFALAAISFCRLSAESCCLDLFFAFGDLSPIVITSCCFRN